MKHGCSITRGKRVSSSYPIGSGTKVGSAEQCALRCSAEYECDSFYVAGTYKLWCYLKKNGVMRHSSSANATAGYCVKGEDIIFSHAFPSSQSVGMCKI